LLRSVTELVRYVKFDKAMQKTASIGNPDINVVCDTFVSSPRDCL
jgi:hypothetical protein